jgi:multisubunit Na+/H+ antiporter MnhB subunit
MSHANRLLFGLKTTFSQGWPEGRGVEGGSDTTGTDSVVTGVVDVGVVDVGVGVVVVAWAEVGVG